MKNDCRLSVSGHVRAHWTGPAFGVAVCLLAGLELFCATPAHGQTAFAMEFNQSNNRFGTISLLTGSFSQLGTEGGTLFNDIAATPAGTLYGIVNTTSFVTLSSNNGAILSSVAFNVGGIESLALSPGGTLYGATQSALYTLNALNGNATLVGNFNNALLNGSGQNIRFASDGNLYDTDGGVSANNTDLFQISLLNGQAMLMGVVTNFPGLCLENAGSQMYGVGIQLGSASSLYQDLVGIDLSSLMAGGTNSDGSPLDVRYNLLTPNFPNNFNVSSADSFVVPSPEPGSVSLCVLGGIMFLILSRSRPRC